MRDMPARKFETAARGMGFSPVPTDERHAGAPVFAADDGLRVAAVLHGERWNGGVRVHRRRTLAVMSAARKEFPRMAGRIYAGAAHFIVSRSDTTANEEAPGVAAPRASV